MIRHATLEDVPAIVEMSRLFYATTFYSTWAEFDDETVEELASNLTENHLMMVAEDEGRHVGMVGLFAAPFMFNKHVKAAYEVVWYVSPSYERKGLGRALLKAIRPECQRLGLKAAQMVRLKTSPEQARLLYESEEYQESEICHTRVF